jgi:hypothetical protein
MSLPSEKVGLLVTHKPKNQRIRKGGWEEYERGRNETHEFASEIVSGEDLFLAEESGEG